MFTKNLQDNLSAWKEEYNSAKPFNHIVIDELFDASMLSDAVTEFPDSKEFRSRDWSRFAAKSENLKAGLNGPGLLQLPKVYKALSCLNSDEFMSFLRELLDIPSLQKDDTYRGGGLHEISPGGHLSVHLDFSKHGSMWRRANCLLYLNKDWDDDYGGHLELYDAKPSLGGKCVKKIAPIFNRLVIFGTCKESWHGHPTPLTCPPTMKRRSLASYYYSNEPGEDNITHGTIF